jgi:hypothetical protein
MKIETIIIIIIIILLFNCTNIERFTELKYTEISDPNLNLQVNRPSPFFVKNNNKDTSRCRKIRHPIPHPGNQLMQYNCKNSKYIIKNCGL